MIQILLIFIQRDSNNIRSLGSHSHTKRTFVQHRLSVCTFDEVVDVCVSVCLSSLLLLLSLFISLCLPLPFLLLAPNDFEYFIGFSI